MPAWQRTWSKRLAWSDRRLEPWIVGVAEGGSPDRTRTCDLSLRRQALYPLSYGRGLAAALAGDRRLAVQAFPGNPLVGVAGDFRAVPRLVDDLIAANRAYLPPFPA
jgi:hypothetical protein